MILPIYVYGTDVLREKACEVNVKGEQGLQELIENMYLTMRQADGVGIAAPQVGRSLRILIVDGSDLAEDMPELAGFKRIMINPVVLQESEQIVEYSEGCLSVPDIHADVARPTEIKVKYFNEKLEEVTEDLAGFGCRMVQHELDHLDGVLFIDRVSPIRKKMLQAKLANMANGKVNPHYKVVKKGKR